MLSFLLGVTYVYYDFRISLAGDTTLDILFFLALITGAISTNFKSALKNSVSFFVGDILGLLYFFIGRIERSEITALGLCSAVSTLVAVAMLPWIIGQPCGLLIGNILRKRLGKKDGARET